ncbi:DUF2383 domain-containing protein [Candidatus Obscuribacterales bacterium]|nr:DUF2383 domain-containing protein [Candidatus Obscuribacterales bacterium]MBX3136970.1 DUF2383 domain-containing protein [Candidatus Obscuribacterales bacterium]MBX3149832.1 DUF2383 domain-containing protein [Candidatus Obscuribacterales bacterium]
MSTEYSHEFNSLLAGEISAVETYDLALKRDFSADLVDMLMRCRDSHSARVDKLVNCVLGSGGTPDESGGAFGAFAQVVQNSQSSAHDALSQLELFEAERLVQYENARSFVPEEVKQVIDTDLLPMQHETHLMVSTALRQINPLPAQ